MTKTFDRQSTGSFDISVDSNSQHIQSISFQECQPLKYEIPIPATTKEGTTKNLSHLIMSNEINEGKNIQLPLDIQNIHPIWQLKLCNLQLSSTIGKEIAHSSMDWFDQLNCRTGPRKPLWLCSGSKIGLVGPANEDSIKKFQSNWYQSGP